MQNEKLIPRSIKIEAATLAAIEKIDPKPTLGSYVRSLIKKDLLARDLIKKGKKK